MSLFKTSFWTGGATLIKAIMSYVMWKIIAVNIGPAGIALIEQFQNFIQISRVSIPAGINEGVVKYVSEHKDNEAEKSDILSNAMAMNLLIFAIASITLILFSRDFSYVVFQSANYQKIIVLTAAGILLYIINNFGLSLLNAEMEVKKYVACTVTSTVCNFILTSYLVIHYGLLGGFIAFALNQTVTGVFTAYLVVFSKWFKIQLFFSKINLICIKKLTKYSLIPLSASFIGPISSFILTKYVVHSLTWTDAGYWHAIMRLSSGYLIVLARVFGFYFLPRYSSLKKTTELKAEVVKSHYCLLPLILLGACVVFILKKQIITVMYSKEFLPVIPLFKYQLIGDVARTSTWLLKRLLAAKALVKSSIIMECFFTCSYIFLTILFVQYFGLIGTAIAFAINYVLYWIVMIIFSVVYLNRRDVLSKPCVQSC